MEAQEASQKTDLSPTPVPFPQTGTPTPGLPAGDSSALPQGSDSQATPATSETAGQHKESEMEKVTHAIQVAETEAKLLLTEAEANSGVKIVIGDASTFGEFWLKFLNDWAFNFASGLAYH